MRPLEISLIWNPWDRSQPVIFSRSYCEGQLPVRPGPGLASDENEATTGHAVGQSGDPLPAPVPERAFSITRKRPRGSVSGTGPPHILPALSGKCSLLGSPTSFHQSLQ